MPLQSSSARVAGVTPCIHAWRVRPPRILCMVRAVTATLVLLGTSGPLHAGRPHVFHHEEIIGTSLELQVATTGESQARQVERLVLDELQRLEAILSTYRADSQFARWFASQGTPQPVAPEIVAVLRRFDHWHDASRGALNPAVGILEQVWQEAERRGAPPTEDELSAARQTLRGPHWRIEASTSRVEHLTTCPLTLNALAKGYLLDSVCDAVARSGLPVEGILINLGGDLRVQGQLDAPVAITDPRQDEDNGVPLHRITVRDRGVATSGNYRRGYDIGGRHYSHILDPATGQPVDHVRSATVVAPTATDADALATVLSVLSPDEGIALVERQPDTACLLVLADGSQRTSAGWPALESAPQTRTRVAAAASEGEAASNAPADAAAPAMELVVQMEVNRPGGGGYRRPYIAVWIEDKDDLAIRTLALWLQKDNPGPRWHRDLRRWYRADQERQLVDDIDLIETISAATRPPGKYKIVWDGKDDSGKLVPTGKYRLFVEVAREHGTYQLMQHELNLDGKPFDFSMDGNVEIKSISAQYRAKDESR